MALQSELSYPRPIRKAGHEALLNIVVTGAMLAKEGDRILRPLGLTDSQFNVMMLLRHQSEDGVLNQTRLGRMLLVNRANITGLIDRLEKAGWVERTAAANDRRANNVRLTVKGQRLLDRAEKAYYAVVDRLTGDLSPQDQKRLCRALETIRGRLRGEE